MTMRSGNMRLAGRNRLTFLVSWSVYRRSIWKIAMPSIFTKIIAREIPAEILHEDDVCLAFRDINPQGADAYLVIPKKEIMSLADFCDEDEQIVGRCLMAASKLAADEGLDGGYRLVSTAAMMVGRMSTSTLSYLGWTQDAVATRLRRCVEQQSHAETLTIFPSGSRSLAAGKRLRQLIHESPMEFAFKWPAVAS